MANPTVRKFSSFEEADKAEKAYYLSLTPNERLAILAQLNQMLLDQYETRPQLARVYRIIELPKI